MSAVPVVELEPNQSPVPLILADEAESETDAKSWGLTTSIGVPSGVELSLIYRPVFWLRGSAGAAYNGVSGGGQAGAAVGYFSAPFTPTLSVEAGTFAEGSAVALGQRFGADLSSVPAARRVGYQYGSAQLGLEFGWPQRFTFRIGAGLSYAHATLHDTQATLRSLSGDTRVVAGDLTLNAVLPSLTLGCVAYLL